MSTKSKIVSILVIVVLMLLPILNVIQQRKEVDKKAKILADTFVDTQIMGLQAKSYIYGPTVIFFRVDFDYLESEVKLDFYDPKGLLVETTEQMFCTPNVYIFRFPYFGKQPAGIYFCRLTCNGKMIKMIKFVYLSGEPRDSAHPKWAGFFFLIFLRYNA